MSSSSNYAKQYKMLLQCSNLQYFYAIMISVHHCTEKNLYKMIKQKNCTFYFGHEEYSKFENATSLPGH